MFEVIEIEDSVKCSFCNGDDAVRYSIKNNNEDIFSCRKVPCFNNILGIMKEQESEKYKKH